MGMKVQTKTDDDLMFHKMFTQFKKIKKIKEGKKKHFEEKESRFFFRDVR